MKKNIKRTRLQSLDNAQLAQVSGGDHASPELLSACIQLLDAMGDPGTVTNVVIGSAIRTALT